MAILCTMPGRHGDILWSLPTVRAIAEGTGEPVYLAVSPKYSSLRPLLDHQPYIAGMAALPDWEVEESAPMSPRIPPTPQIEDYFALRGATFDHVIHLGYKGWPSRPLPQDIYEAVYNNLRVPLAPLDLSRPWITAPWTIKEGAGVIVGFTDEHFELKYGIWWLLYQHLTKQEGLRHPIVNLSTSPRWAAEAESKGYDWEAAAAWIASGPVFLGCCSALHVLAVAVGCPAVVMEPAEARLNPIFWPLGQDGPQVTLVKGNDGKATFDARHVLEVVEKTRTTQLELKGR